MDGLITRLIEMRDEINNLMSRLKIDEKAAQISDIESQASAPTFWDDPEAAQQLMQKMSRLKAQVERWQKMHQRASDALELAELGDDMLDELTVETDALAAELDKMSLQAMLSGEYDDEDAILSIHAGAGGVDAQDWAEILERMYLRWMEQSGYKAEVIERSVGDEAGVKSVTIAVKGDYAYGYLQSEQGVHRLVRISPFDSNARRHTSFAKVELWPDIAEEIDIEIKETDIRVDVFRSSGPGGQSVNTTDSAVRITHLPTGLVVSSQNQKSQHQNKDRALQVLKARLFDLERQKQQQELAALKGENVDAGWGNQIRSYVMHPYQMVKDHRTNHETGQVNAVLDGRLDEFMEAYLRSKIVSTTNE
ncbi:peptide chain release factor 2 [Phototrophicus methaneseepsis]|uniref:Peptide chain release factor 2 n=1 Tax=Phototrophicus methaneseepsis TaxID=2710758 RepID=A0A7S8IDE0_9CHLR|nr:peptide chain release factor 2 [Phototrophicus methaneseepsis]QPC81436.1 peptide chain release factor 2 [Phototrophicus methaneseepsis]